MSDRENATQLVTFQLGKEIYGIDIMDVRSIEELSEIRLIPQSPSYVSGILTLRGEIIPIIDLHKRFNLPRLQQEDTDNVLSGYMIIQFEQIKLGIIIDRIVKVETIGNDSIQPPPQVLTGIGREYIEGVVHFEDAYLIILNLRKLFSSKELQQLHSISK